MANRLERVPLATYTPAVPGVPGRAAFCVVNQVLVGYTSIGGKNLASGSASETRMTYSPPPSLAVAPYEQELQDVTAAISWYLGNNLESQLQPRYADVQTCYPAVAAVPATPAKTDPLANVGWNAGATSQAPVPVFGAFRGTVPAVLSAVQLGLADRYFDHTYQYMPHSLVARPGEWAVVERGVTKATGALPAGATLEVRRLGGKVVYLANDAELHVSETPSAGTVYGAALLYSLADSVEDPSVRGLDQVLRLSSVLPALRMIGADRPDLMLLDSESPLWQLAGRLSRVHGVTRLQGTLPSIRLLGSDRQLLLMSGALPVADLEARLGRKERLVEQFLGVLPPMLMSATLVSGGSMRVDVDFPAVLGIGADRQLAFLKGAVPVAVLVAHEPYMPPNEIDGLVSNIAYDRAVLETALLLLAVDSLDVQSATAELIVIVELATADTVELRDDATLGQLVEMLAIERVAVNSATSVARRQALQYAVNLATGALTTYDGFDFSGFARDEQNAYGWKPDGLYRIGAPLDDGAVLQALVDFGTDDFADSRVKRLGYAYLGVRTDGQCFLRVQADVGAERVYRVRGGNNVRRSKLADGVSGRYWSLRLEIVDASFAEIDSLELPIGVTQRRTFGSRN